jgi:hypothetical protein
MNPKATTLALALLSIGHSSAGDVVTLTWRKDAPANAQTAVLTLAAGESAKAKWGGASSNGGTALGYDGVSLNLTIGGTSRTTGPVTGNSPSAPMPLEVSGPATITLSGAGTVYDFAIATFEVTRPASPSVTPSNAAVVPVDANGTFTVILESSTDLINWTAANPGDYSGNTVKRFFRSRIVKK